MYYSKHVAEMIRDMLWRRMQQEVGFAVVAQLRSAHRGSSQALQKVYITAYDVSRDRGMSRPLSQNQ